MASDNKYDRQLRLWGAAGQKALMESRILLLTASATGTEIVKNLVLPGCGFITVVDPAMVCERDLGNNFFVTPDSVGKPRAQVTLDLLLEMNEDVRGDCVVRDPLELVVSNPSFLAGYTLVVATQLPEPALRRIADVAWQLNVPLLAARTYGLLGALRLVKREHAVVESKVEMVQPALRVARPFPALAAFAAGIDVGGLDDMTHAHVPYVVLLVRALSAYKAAHGGVGPSTPAEKEAFRSVLTSGCRLPLHESTNFCEALKVAYTAWADPIPSDTRSLLGDSCCGNLTPTSPDFWVVVRGMAEFVGNEGGGELPLSGVVPDMTATTELFLALQRTYAVKASEDVAAVASRVYSLLTSVGRHPGAISHEYVAHVCKHAASLRVLRYRSLEEEYAGGASGHAAETLREELGDAVSGVEGDGRGEDGEETPAAKRAAQHPLAWYLALRAADRFAAQHGRYPGSEDASVESDGGEVSSLLSALVSELGLEGVVGVGGLLLGPRHAAEVTRYGGGETHAVAAILGGVGAQEAVKLVTGQYVPLDNTFIHNGIAGTSGTYRL